MTGGEGSGKSYHAALYAVCRALYDPFVTGEGKQLYWVVGQDFEDAKKEFDYIHDFVQRLGAVETAHLSHDQQCRLTLAKTGQEFVTISAYDVTKLGREEPTGIVGAEVSRWDEEAFKRCEGRLARKYPHSWGMFSGSFESSLGWLPAMWNLGQGPNLREVRSFSVPTWANTVRYPGGETDPAIAVLREGSSPERFLERYGGRPAPPLGAIMSNFNRLLHVDPEVMPLPGVPVYLAIDPGTKVYAVLFVQFTPQGEVLVLDEVYAQRWTHRQVIEAVRLNPLWGLVKLVKKGAIDIAAKQSHMGMPVPLEEWYNDMGMVLWAQKLPLNDSIERVRAVMTIDPRTSRPRLRIHPRCVGLISELGGGPSPVEGGGPWLYTSSHLGFGPPEPRNNHATMALAYLLAGPFGLSALPYYYDVPQQTGPVSYLSKRDKQPIPEKWW